MKVTPSAPPLGHDNLGLQINDELQENFNIYNQSIYNDTDSAKMARFGYHNPFYHQPEQAPISPGSPTSEISFQRTFSVRSKHSNASHYTRQINMSIGEEWENVHDPTRKAFTCPPTPKRHQICITQPLSPWSEKPEPVSEHVVDEPLRYFFNRLSEEERVAPKDYVIEPNPHNKCNHKLHAVLHCPCFFFFCLLCCLPGVHYMERSDEEYRTGHEDRAKFDGRISTVLYTLGLIAASMFLSGLIFFSVSVVHGQVNN